MKELLLDCEDSQQIYTSLSSIMGISIDKINSEFDKYNIEDDPAIRSDSFDKVILSHFSRNLKIKTNFSGSFFFHFTRVPLSSTFVEGILNYNQMIPKISSLILKYAGLSDFDIENSNANNCFHYLKKSENESLIGPYAFLIRDHLIDTRKTNKYLHIPEIVEDFINCAFPSRITELINTYKNSTSSCVVKFRSNLNDKMLLGVALYYIYCLHRLPKPFSDNDLNFNYDGKGISIKYQDIDNVEFIPAFL